MMHFVNHAHPAPADNLGHFETAINHVADFPVDLVHQFASANAHRPRQGQERWFLGAAVW